MRIICWIRLRVAFGIVSFWSSCGGRVGVSFGIVVRLPFLTYIINKAEIYLSYKISCNSSCLRELDCAEDFIIYAVGGNSCVFSFKRVISLPFLSDLNG